MVLLRRLFPVLACGLVMVVVHAVVWMRISPASAVEEYFPEEDGGGEPGDGPASFAVTRGDSWSGSSGGDRGTVGASTSVKLIRSARFLLLEGTVPTDAERARVEETVRGAEPEMLVRNRIRVDAGAKGAPWLAGFPEWWPRLKERVAAPELDAWADPSRCRLWGEVPTEADVERLRDDFTALIGGGTEVDCAGLRRRGGSEKEQASSSAAGEEGDPWIMAVVAKDGILVAGRTGDESLSGRLESALAGRGGAIDLTELKRSDSLGKEIWQEVLPDLVRSLAALSGDGILEIRQGEAWLAARVPSAEEGAALELAVRDLLDGRLRVRTEIFSQDGTRSGRREPTEALTVYFGFGKTDVPELEKRKIKRFAEAVGSVDGGGVLRVIAYASGAEAEADGKLATSRAEAVLGAMPTAVTEKFHPEIEMRRPGWSGGGVVFRQDQRVELELLRMQ